MDSNLDLSYLPQNGVVLPPGFPSTSEDLHAWSIYRQNLNSDFTDSALGSSEKSPMPYGNFHLRETTMQSILNNPKYGPKSELGTNMYTYLKFGLPRVLPPKANSSGYDSTDEEMHRHHQHRQCVQIFWFVASLAISNLFLRAKFCPSDLWSYLRFLGQPNIN